MKKIIYLFSLIICFSINAQEFFHEDGYSFAGSSKPLIEKDNQGNLISTGGFTTAVNIDGVLVQGNASQANSYIIKHSTEGAVAWYKTLFAVNSGSQDQAEIKAVAVDNNDNIYIAGEYFGTLNFDGNTYAFQARDIFIIKLNAAGVTQWVKRIGENSGFDSLYDMEVDNLGNVNLTGKASTTGFTFNNSSPSSSNTFFLAQLNSAGAENWINYFETIGNGAAKIAVNSSNNDIFLSFNYDRYSSQNFTIGATTIDVSTALGASNVIAKFNSVGTGINATNYTVGSTQEFIACTDIKVNDLGNVVVLYDHRGDMMIDGTTYSSVAGVRNPLLVELNSSWTAQWVTQIPASIEVILVDLELGVDNTYLVGGYMLWNVIINNETYATNGQRDGILIALSNTGNLLKAKKIGGTSNDEIKDITSFSADSIFTAITFQGNITLDNNQTIINSGMSAISGGVVKLSFDDCILNIPDINLRNALLAQGNTITGAGISNIDTDNSGAISCAEAAAYSGKVNLSSQTISDATGLEAFTGITELNISQNAIANIDVSTMPGLIELIVSNNQLSNLNISQNTLLERLDVSFNSLSALDVSQNTALTYLQVRDNQITSIDCNALLNLEEAYVYNNLLTTLDLSNNPMLFRVEANNNNLTEFNMANGTNTAITYFRATDNPNLNCIEVDDEVYSTANWTFIDATTSFSEDCSNTSGGSGVGIEENSATQLSAYPNPTTGKITITSIEKIDFVTVFNSLGEVVAQFDKHTFSIEHLVNGVYTLSIETENMTHIKKVVKR